MFDFILEPGFQLVVIYTTIACLIVLALYLIKKYVYPFVMQRYLESKAHHDQLHQEKEEYQRKEIEEKNKVLIEAEFKKIEAESKKREEERKLKEKAIQKEIEERKTGKVKQQIESDAILSNSITPPEGMAIEEAIFRSLHEIKTNQRLFILESTRQGDRIQTLNVSVLGLRKTIHKEVSSLISWITFLFFIIPATLGLVYALGGPGPLAVIGGIVFIAVIIAIIVRISSEIDD